MYVMYSQQGCPQVARGTYLTMARISMYMKGSLETEACEIILKKGRAYRGTSPIRKRPTP